MSIENVHRSADAVCSRDAPYCRDKSCDITDIRGGEVSLLLSGYKGTNIIHNKTAVNFIFESVDKKWSVKIMNNNNNNNNIFVYTVSCSILNICQFNIYIVNS
jgi:D-Tyr-tRNAtyr deacylase